MKCAKVRTFALAALPALWITNVGAQPAPAEMEGPRVGDRWSYEVKDEITGELKQTVTFVATEISPKEITTRMTARGAPAPRTFVFDPAWNRIDDMAWKFTPNDGSGILLPLSEGKEWSFENDALSMGSGTTLHGSGRTKIVSKESLTTKAGTFDTYRLQSTARQTNNRDNTKSSESIIDTWYAPAVNRWVKRTIEIRFEGRLRDKTSEELVEYSRKP